MNKTFRIAAIPGLGLMLYLMMGLCAAGEITIMPLGDSGTVGIDYYTLTSGGYRDPLYRDLVASNISFKFIGSSTDCATPALTAAGQTHHNGYGGYTLKDLDGNLSAGACWFTSGGAVIKPTIILLEAGANDFLRLSATAETAGASLKKLITDIHALTPDSIILVAGIYPFAGQAAGFNSKIHAYDLYIQKALVPSMTYTRYVDNYTSYFNADGSVNGLLFGADNIHPTRYGYPIWASNWATEIRALEGSKPSLYRVTVNNGTVNNVGTSGSFPAGSVVTINWNGANGGREFGSWTPGTQAICNPYWKIATYIVPATDSTVTANDAAVGSPMVPNGTYQIAAGSYQLGWCDGLSMGAAAASAGSAVQTQTYSGAPTQQWTLTNLPSVNGTNNVVELSLAGTKLALGVAEGATAGGAGVDVESYTGTPGQQWVITPVLGTIQIINVGSGQVININGYVIQNNWELHMQPAGYLATLASQVWSFYPVSSGGAAAAPAQR